MASSTVNILLSFIALLSTGIAQFNNPPGVDIWCGKAYRPLNASFNPGGQFPEPQYSGQPLLSFKVTPRMSIYLDDETTGSFLVNASISHLRGTAIKGWKDSGFGEYDLQTLDVAFMINGKHVDAEKSTVQVGKVQEVFFNLSSISARHKAHDVKAIATSTSGQKFTASTEFIKLPIRTDNGTAVRIDNLYGGLAVRKAAQTKWESIFPFTYYVQWTLYWNQSVSTLQDFNQLGYNMIHIVPTGELQDQPFPWHKFQPYLDKAASLGLYFQYDVLWTPTNQTSMLEQVKRLKSHPSMLLWYIADEPDGKSNPLNSTRLGYEQIRELDLYHPVSEALNCYDFYYGEYAAGADIILSDVYPVGTNTSFSTVYGTVCNATYGCCGCDDCEGAFEDVSDRLDNFARVDDLLGWQKTHWNVPQAFGNETFWTRYPTAAEEVVMNILGINHGAKGSVMWDYPTSPAILDITNRLAHVLTSAEVTAFLTSTPRFQGLEVSGGSRVDATAWTADDGAMLVAIVNLNYGDIKGGVALSLPKGVDVAECVVDEVLWGDAVWHVGEDGALTTDGLKGLEVSILVLRQA